MGVGPKSETDPWRMTQCDAAGTVLESYSILESIAAWGSGAMTEYFWAEDGSRWDGTSDYWVAGAACRPPG